MKRIYLILIICSRLQISGDLVYAQPNGSLAFRPTWYNYQAPLRDNTPTLSDIFGKNSGGGVELTYYRRLLPNILLGLPLRMGSAQINTRGAASERREWLVHLDVLAQQHFLKPSAVVQPYVHIGVGGVYNIDQHAFGVHFPVGLGLNVRIIENVYLTAQTQHRFSNDNRDAWHHAVGVQFNFGREIKPRKEEKTTPPAPTDRDGDGIADAEDRCPDQPGPSATFGCPDRDGDGVPDQDDRCPDRPGPASNFGCPEVAPADRDILTAAMRNVQFATNSANLLPASYAVLDQIAALMERYPEHQLIISGHTDSVGDDKFNLDLSKRRAKACYDYLTSKGVDPARISYDGYGETRPIADNNTEAGRAKNRRVEFELRLR